MTTATRTPTTQRVPTPGRTAHGVPLHAPHGRRHGVPAPRDATALVAALGRWYWEVLDGRRDPRQLRHLLSPACERRVCAAATDQHQRRRLGDGGRSTVTEVRRASVVWRDGVGEGIALVRRGARTTAVVVTLERHRGRCRVIDIARPEGSQGPLPAPRHR